MRFYRDEYDDQFNDEFNSRNYNGRVGEEFNSRRINGKFEGKFEDVINSREFEDFKRKHGIPDELFENLKEGEVQEIIEDNGNRRVIKRVVRHSYNGEQPFEPTQRTVNKTYIVGDPSIVKGKKSFSKNMIIGIVAFALYFLGMAFLVFTNDFSDTTITVSVGSNLLALLGFYLYFTHNYRKEHLTYLLFPIEAFVINGFVLYSIIAKLSYYELKDTAFRVMLIIGGIFYIVASIIRYTNKKKYCTMDVEAYVVGYDIIGRFGNDRTRKKAPIYEFYYNGHPIRVTSEKHKEFFYSREGTRVVIKIDPDDPRHFYEEQNDNVVLKVIVGLAAIAFGIVCLVVLK
ncbi:MAG: hypothetical protein U0L20_00690 [Ruminococcus sp.]|nr:hypothetical protein [Ruminococcus sp.]